MTFPPDARGNPEAASAVDAFRARGFEPEGYTLNAYAAVQVWRRRSQMPERWSWTRSSKRCAKSASMTALGTLNFDEKGDVTASSYVWYVWYDGRYMPRD